MVVRVGDTLLAILPLKASEMRAGPAKLNSPMRVDTAPEGEDIACENWSKYEQKTPPHALRTCGREFAPSRLHRM